jgi:hypothetical protein
VTQPGPDPVGGPLHERVGFTIQWVPEDATFSSNWRLVTDAERETKSCRRPGCQRPVAAALHRKHSFRSRDTWVWWFYCDWHLYGRRIRDGALERRAYVANDEAA